MEMSGETLEFLKAGVERQEELNSTERGELLRSSLSRRLDLLLTNFGDHIADLTVDGALKEIIRDKNVELARALSAAEQAGNLAGNLKEQVERLRAENAKLRRRVVRARRFKYLIRTLGERLLERAGLREPPELF